MALHKNLTGTELHEPKGADAAASGTIYVANGSGSGVWTVNDASHLILNKYWLTNQIPDVSTVSSKTYFFVEKQSELLSIGTITSAALTTANSTLTIYINGVAFADTLTVTQAGSVAGTLHFRNIATTNTIPAGSTIEVRSDGLSDTTAIGHVTLGLVAK